MLYKNVFQPEIERVPVVLVSRLAWSGGQKGDPNVCGAMTSGGTESILSAVKASRDFMRATKGITEPEMIIGDSAHAAFFKAAEYFKIKLRQVGLKSPQDTLFPDPLLLCSDLAWLRTCTRHECWPV